MRGLMILNASIDPRGTVREWALRDFTDIMLLLSCVHVLGYTQAVGATIEKSPFLRPYVQQLKKSTASDELDRIKTMAESELILLHHGYGTGIRNRWLHGNRDPKLLQFFRENRIVDLDEMSMVVIKALWQDLNSAMTPEEIASVTSKRALVARRRSVFEKLESEGSDQLARAKGEIDRCYASHGLPSKNPKLRDPFFKLRIEKSGRVRKIIFFEGASADLKACLAKTIEKFSFSPFRDDEVLTLYILSFPACRIAERDTLHR